MPAPERPFISVAVPTFRRPAMLERAIRSVAAQTFRDWELVVVDDERGAGETWELLGRLRREVRGLRVFKNAREPGQVGNVNTALLRARGAWIKLLHDDDWLYPRCLAVLADLAARHPDVACIACACDRVAPGGVRPYRRGRWPLLERVPSAEIVPAMYLLEDLGEGLPTTTFLARRVVRDGTLYEERPGVSIAADTWFNARVAAHGDLLVLREALVAYRVGHDSVTTRALPTRLDEELVAIRHELRSLVPAERRLPPADAMVQAVHALRVLVHVRRGRPRAAVALLARVRDPRSLAALARWALHRLSAGRYSRVRRHRLEPRPAER